MMKALVKKKAERGIWMGEVPKPEIRETEVLIQIHKTAICGTDVHIYEWNEWAQGQIPIPMHVGHEFVGTIAKLGSEVKAYKVGDRVSGEGHIVCGHCRNCRAGTRHLCINTRGVGVHRPGAFAEYLALPAENVFPIPDNISDDEAAILDPLGNAVHTAISFDVIGEDVLVTGAGPIGIMGAVVAKHVGARNVVITDINDFRLELAADLGLKKRVNVEKDTLESVMQELQMTEGFDIGLEMSGSPAAFRSMIDLMKPGGRLALLGLLPSETAISWDAVIFKGLFLKGIYGREMFETWYKMCSLLQSGLNIDAIITHRFGIKDYQKGFELMASGRSGKIILDWS